MKITKNNGFTLIELVMTIILTGILSVGLYEVVMFGISDYMTNETYLHSSNLMTYAMSVIRRNLVNAAMPKTTLTITRRVLCPLNNYPNNGQGSKNLPVTLACQDGSAPSCPNNTCPVSGSCSSVIAPSEVAFYQNVTVNGTASQQLVVFCVNNSILYEEVKNGTGTTSYPIANNISGIGF
ncbi:MAG: prepilin-type N-terminal cleavage/methylation domain-containing protein [bacterium]